MRARLRLALAGAALAVALAGCLETTGNNYVVYEPGTTQRAKTTSTKTATVTAKANPSATVRAELKSACELEHGGLLGGGEKVARQCDCYAVNLMKTMGQNDREFYAQYKVMPTLGVAKPEDVKKQCGIALVEGGDRLPPPPGS